MKENSENLEKVEVLRDLGGDERRAFETSRSMAPHGTRARYSYRGCRCVPCALANLEYRRERKTNGPRFVAPEAVAEHIRQLSRAGVGLRAIAKAADVDRRNLYLLASGARTKTHIRIAERILAVDQSALEDSALVSAGKTHRLIRKLTERGYTKSQLAQWLGFKGTSLQLWRPRITARNAVAVQRLYKLIDAGKISSDRKGPVFAIRASRLGRNVSKALSRVLSEAPELADILQVKRGEGR